MREAQDKSFAIYSTVKLLFTTVRLIIQMYLGAQLWVSSVCHQDTWYFGCGSVAIVSLNLVTNALTVRHEKKTKSKLMLLGSRCTVVG